jgi:hypothetical protein
MAGPQMQRVVFLKQNGKIRYVKVGYMTRSKGDPEASMVCAVGDEPGLEHISLEDFKKMSDDIPPEFVNTVELTLRNAPERQAAFMRQQKVSPSRIVITITIDMKNGGTVETSV